MADSNRRAAPLVDSARGTARRWVIFLGALFIVANIATDVDQWRAYPVHDRRRNRRAARPLARAGTGGNAEKRRRPAADVAGEHSAWIRRRGFIRRRGACRSRRGLMQIVALSITDAQGSCAIGRNPDRDCRSSRGPPYFVRSAITQRSAYSSANRSSPRESIAAQSRCRGGFGVTRGSSSAW